MRMAYNVQVCDAVSDGIYYLLGSDTVSAVGIVTMSPTCFQVRFFFCLLLRFHVNAIKRENLWKKRGKSPAEQKISNAISKFLDSIADLGEWECN